MVIGLSITAICLAVALGVILGWPSKVEGQLARTLAQQCLLARKLANIRVQARAATVAPFGHTVAFILRSAASRPLANIPSDQDIAFLAEARKRVSELAWQVWGDEPQAASNLQQLQLMLENW